MVRSALVGLVVVLLIAKAATGLRMAWSNSAERTDRVSFAPTPKNYDVHADNGSVEVNGQNDESANVEVMAILQASAHDEESATEALNAMELTVTGKESDTCKIGWQWKTPQKPDWSGSVRFHIAAPKHVNVVCEASNGSVTVNNLTGTARLKSHNGRITSETSGETLDATAENGQIDSKFSGKHISLHTANGVVTADVSKAGAIEGDISTQNGAVTLTVGDHTSCKLSASAVNGRVRGATQKQSWIKKFHRQHSVNETLGEGGKPLKVTVQNGSIRIKHVKNDDDADDSSDESDD